MEKKKIVIAAAALLLILAGISAYRGEDKGTEEDVASVGEYNSRTEEESSISDSYSQERDMTDSTAAGSGSFAILEKLVDAYPNMDFTNQQDVSFDWMTGSGGSQKLEGKSIEAAGVAGRVDLSNFFEKAGFEEDLGNTADGTANGQQGFSDGETACLYEYTSQGESVEGAGKDSLLYDIKVSCAEMSQ